MAANNTKKKTTSGRSQSSSRGRNSSSAKRKQTSAGSSFDSKIAREALVLITIALAIIFFLANFHIGGIVGDGISSFFFGLFGLIAYVFPFILVFGVLFSVANKNSSVAKIKIIAGVFAMIFVCTFIQLVCGHHAKEWKAGDYYMYSSLHRNGGGFIGGMVCRLFVTLFGSVGAYIIDIVLFIICGVIISEHSFLGGLKKGGQKFYNTAKNDMEQYRESSEEKRKTREEEKLKRASRKVSGVDFNATVGDENDKAEQAEPSFSRKKKQREDPVFEFEKAAEETPAQEEPDNHIFGADVKQYEPKAFEYEHYAQEQDNFYYPEEEEEIVEPEPYAEKSTIANSEPDAPYEDEAVDEEKRAAEARAILEELNKNSGKAENAQPKEDAEKEPVEPVVPKEQPVKYVFPPLSLLKRGNGQNRGTSQAELRSTAMKLQQTLANFGVKVTVTDVSCGPAVTRYEIQPEQGVKVSKIVSLADDIKLNLAAADIRIEAPIPGKAAVGIEVPNKETTGVFLGDLVAGEEFRNHPSSIAFNVGKDIAGKNVIADIGKMPHLLIAGATGSGKSVCINTIIMSLLYKADPKDVKLIMVDPKVVELSVYNGIPHLLIPVVTDPKKAAAALNWAVGEMDERYEKFAFFGARDLKGYNEKVRSVKDVEGENKQEEMPQIVIVVDELADLMMVASNEVETAIVRLAQKARAAGIHLIIATQRPSVNVITGLIKANVPSRIAFSVASGVDSRTIIDMNGAEKLLGKGDMLFYPQGYQKPARVQGAFVSDEEVAKVVDFIKDNSQNVTYSESVGEKLVSPAFNESQAFGGDQDEHFAKAGRFIIEKKRASIGMLQRVYKIGFNRAARIMDQLCDAGVVGPEEGTKPRKVLMTLEEFEEYLKNNSN